MSDDGEAAIQPWSAGPITTMELIVKAIERGDVGLVERMIALQERIERNEAKREFDAAMAAACAEMPILVKSELVDFAHKERGGRTRYNYEDLAKVVEVVAPILGKHGLYHSFDPVTEPGKPIIVRCMITHKRGHSINVQLSGPADTSGQKNSLQAVGSTITYLSRYALKAALGLAAAVDDDAQATGPAAPPVAGPDPMRTPRIVPDDLSAGPRPEHEPPQLGTPGPPPLSPKWVALIQEEARMAADRGQVAFNAFWKRMNTVAAQSAIKAIGPELRQRIDAYEAGADRDTGELPDGSPGQDET